MPRTKWDVVTKPKLAATFGLRDGFLTHIQYALSSLEVCHNLSADPINTKDHQCLVLLVSVLAFDSLPLGPSIDTCHLHEADVHAVATQHHADTSNLARLVIVVQHQQRAFGLESRVEAIQPTRAVFFIFLNSSSFSRSRVLAMSGV
ncbi:hypothetical protein HYQ46_006341 [Verticillium longisporum]|nr:hypothetical protein HYQ46_006341 [Verticillium longisporum]